MNWEAIGAIGELVGAVAVVATLIYLARQVRQSNTHARRTEIDETLQQFSIARMAVVQDEGLADLVLKGSNNYEDLLPGEKLRFENLMDQRIWVWHSIWDGVQSNAFESYFWIGEGQQIVEVLRQPGTAAWWAIHKLKFPAEYVAEIDRLLADDA